MMPAPQSRRRFLKSVVLAATATAAGGLFAPTAAAAGGRGVNTIVPLDLGGLAIADHVVGGVVAQNKDFDYLTFDAWKHAGAGTAVIRLTDCVAWRARTDGDQHLFDGTVDPSELKSGRAFEVLNSTWVWELAEDDAELNPATLHHCVFTFRETSFECVVARYDHNFHTGPFDAVYESVLADTL